jgi:hypothetical protein
MTRNNIAVVEIPALQVFANLAKVRGISLAGGLLDLYLTTTSGSLVVYPYL